LKKGGWKKKIFLRSKTWWVLKNGGAFPGGAPPPPPPPATHLHLGPEYFQEQTLKVTPWSRRHKAPPK